MDELYYVVVYVPIDHADAIREILANNHAGEIGAYDSCSFSTVGTGRFRPLPGATPHVGTYGKLEKVDEERIEVVVKDQYLSPALLALRDAHPYEEPAIIVMKIENYNNYL